MTINDLIRESAERLDRAELFYGHGTADAIDEAVYLVLASLNLPYDVDEVALQQGLDDADRRRILALVDDRITSRKPAAYLLGHCQFAGYSFRIDKRALVPRSPIAELIIEQFRPWLRNTGSPRVLDLCTGSGCIGIATALALPGAEVDLADLSADALSLAAENVALHGLADRIRLHQSDLFDQLDECCYDLIVSNPPYVGSEEWQGLPAEYHHEPEMGLVSCQNGLEIPLRIIESASRYLKPDGILILEVGYSADALAERLSGEPLMWLEFEHGGEGVVLMEHDQLRHLAVSMNNVEQGKDVQ